MGPGNIIRETWTAIPVVLLLFAGSVIALKSGSEEPSATRRTFRQFLGNFYQMTLRITGYVAVLLALQYWIGMRPLMGW